MSIMRRKLASSKSWFQELWARKLRSPSFTSLLLYTIDRIHSQTNTKKRSMSLLVPDYASSSDDEAEVNVTVSAVTTAPPPSAPPAATASLEQLLPPPSTKATKRRRQPTKKKQTKKPKTALFLHPDIQRLLESGASRAPGDSSDSDDNDDDSLLAKQKRAIAAKRPRPAASASVSSAGLSFLPPPKHAVEAPDNEEKPTQPHVLESHSNVDASGHEETTEPAVVAPAAPLAQDQQPVTASYDVAAPTQTQQQQYYDHGYYDAAQYQYQTQQASYPVVYQGEDETFGSSKRARTRDRELERALQQGHFHSVASKIVEVHGPAPSAWAPAPAPIGKSANDSGELKVKASFWDAQTGARVATVKPNRMQRQKHQLNQLAFDAKLREHELLDKKGASLKTKAETHAKYGW